MDVFYGEEVACWKKERRTKVKARVSLRAPAAGDKGDGGAMGRVEETESFLKRGQSLSL